MKLRWFGIECVDDRGKLRWIVAKGKNEDTVKRRLRKTDGVTSFWSIMEFEDEYSAVMDLEARQLSYWHQVDSAWRDPNEERKGTQ